MAYFAASEIDSLWRALEPHLGRRPALVKAPFGRRMLEDDELLGVLKQWGSDSREGRAGNPDIAKLDAGALPAAGDASLQACMERLESAWKADWFVLLQDIQKYEGAVWERAVEVLRPAIRLHGGLPPGGFRSELFFGRYRATPTGIHLDTSDNVAFVLRGPKRMLFWPGDRFTSAYKIPSVDPTHEEALTGRYREHLKDAVTLDGESGDVFYWPKEWWHVGAASDAPGWSAMLAFPMWWHASVDTVASMILGRALDTRSRGNAPPEIHPVDPDHIDAAALAMPAPLSQALADLRRHLDASLEVTGRVAWIAALTACGFIVPPARRAAPALSGATKLRVAHPIVAVAAGPRALVVACGHSTVTPSLPLASAFQSLGVGAEFDVDSLCRALGANGGGDPAPAALQLAGALCSFRAVETA